MDDASRKGLFVGITIFGPFAAFLLALLSFQIYDLKDNVTQSTEIAGKLEGLYVRPSRGGSSGPWWYIRLPSDQIVPVDAPQSVPYRAGASVVLVREQTAHGHVYYSFKAYTP